MSFENVGVAEVSAVVAPKQTDAARTAAPTITPFISLDTVDPPPLGQLRS
jgi:hypothetical protein